MGDIFCHECPDPGLSLGPNPSSAFNLPDKCLVVQSEESEARNSHFVPFAERDDVVMQAVHGVLDMLDITNRQGGIQPRFNFLFARTNTVPMGEMIDMKSLRANLRRIMASKSVKPTSLSLQIGPSKTLVKDLLEKNDDVRLGTLVKLADALSVSLDDLLALPRVPIAGSIGAGGQIAYEDVGEAFEPDMSVSRPPGISGKLIALMVRGESMLPRYKDGDILYVQREHDGVLPAYIGEDCAVRLSTGETFVKQLNYGSRPGVFTLMSLNAAPMVDVEIEWATLILFVLPGAARRLGQYN